MLQIIIAAGAAPHAFQEVEDIVDTSSVTGLDIVVAIAVLAASWPIAMLAARLTRRMIERIPGAPASAARLAGRAVRVFWMLIGLAISLSLIGLNAGWFTVTVILIILVAILTLRPLVESSAAGLLLETHPAFKMGDEIVTQGYTGQVVAVTARTTVIRTRDGKRVDIPNTDVLSDSLVVLTAYSQRRSSIDLDIEYDADVVEAARLLLDAVSAVGGVHADPPPRVLARGFGPGTYTVSLRWWHDPELEAETRARDGVVSAVRQTLQRAGIGLPAPGITIRDRAPHSET